MSFESSGLSRRRGKKKKKKGKGKSEKKNKSIFNEIALRNSRFLQIRRIKRNSREKFKK